MKNKAAKLACPKCGAPISPELAAKALRSIKSESRAKASRDNGKLGGRPPQLCPTCGKMWRKGSLWMPNIGMDCPDKWHDYNPPIHK